MSVLNKGSLFPTALEKEIFNKVKGHSSLAMMSGQEALPFVGKDIFTFNFSSDVSVVGESATKPAGDGGITPVSVKPVKVVYQMRVSDEFLTASEEYQLAIASAFADGFANKLGAGLDKMAMHGLNPATNTASNVIGTNNFDSKVTTNVVTYSASTPDANIDSAVATIETAGYVPTGAIISPAMRGAIAGLTANGGRKYPEFGFGATPEKLGNMALDTNVTVAPDYALIGDFSAFRWGIAKELPLKVIEYGNPDGQGDLQQSNQIILRSEAYIGYGIMDEKAFAIVKAE